MQKGKLGIRLCFYTVLGFILAAIGASTLLFLLAGVVLLVEKDEWANRQIIQAVFLCLIESVVSNILYEVGKFFTGSILGNVWYKVDSGVMIVVSIIVFAFCIVGILKNLKGEDAEIPLANSFADWAYGVAAEKKPVAASAASAQAPIQETAKEEAPAEKTEE